MENLEQFPISKQVVLSHIELPLLHRDVKEFIVWNFINNFVADISEESKDLIDGRT